MRETSPVLPPADAPHTAEQAAEVLDVPADTIRRWQRTGRAATSGRVPSRGRLGYVRESLLSELRPLAEAYHARRHAAEQRRSTRSEER